MGRYRLFIFTSEILLLTYLLTYLLTNCLVKVTSSKSKAWIYDVIRRAGVVTCLQAIRAPCQPPIPQRHI